MWARDMIERLLNDEDCTRSRAYLNNTLMHL